MGKAYLKHYKLNADQCAALRWYREKNNLTLCLSLLPKVIFKNIEGETIKKDIRYIEQEYYNENRVEYYSQRVPK